MTKVEPTPAYTRWQMAYRAAKKIVARNTGDGAFWLVHRGWLAGYKAGLAAGKAKVNQ